MGYTSALETCSVEVRRGVEWLRSTVDVDKAGARDAEAFYVLKKFDQELVEKYLERANDESFWPTSEWVFRDPPSYVDLGVGCWSLAKLGLGDNPFYMQQLSRVKVIQNREGQIWNPNVHVDILRALVFLEPDSDHTEKAVHCLINNMKEWNGDDIAVGVLALAELDYERYQHEINTGIDRLLDYKNEDGESTGSNISGILSTSWVIQAISRIRGDRDSSVQESTNWLKQQQDDDGSWVCYTYSTAHALLALISAGEGPKIPLAEVEWKETLMNQRIERTKPHFVHTSPISDQRMHVKDIYAKIKDMLNSTKTEIKILSPFIDVMYEDIIDLAENNPNLSIKLITRPPKHTEGTGIRERIARTALKLLEIATEGKLRTNKILHARMIIVDDKEALISSADLTRDQLIDEFNAGIWVRDKETVERATEFFDNIWEESETMK